MKTKNTILIQPSRKKVQFDTPDTLLNLLKKNKIRVMHSCGGNGTCGTCVVKIISTQEDLSKRNDLELEIATDRNYQENERLACQLKIKSSLEINVKEIKDSLHKKD